MTTIDGTKRQSTEDIDRVLAELRPILAQADAHYDVREHALDAKHNTVMAELVCACSRGELVAWLEDHHKPVPSLAFTGQLRNTVAAYMARGL